MIARQMQPGLERLFREFGKELGRPLPPPPSHDPTSDVNGAGSSDFVTDQAENGSLNEQTRLPFNSADYFEDDEDLMRRALETSVTAAIDLFQLVDKQQLSFLGATTDLTGPVVEHLIERYVAEQVHQSLLWPRVCAYRKLEDLELDHKIRHMENLDISQVGMAIDGGRRGREELSQRLANGVEQFRKMNSANSPQEMLETLLATQKAVTEVPEPRAGSALNESDNEKRQSTMTINADVLVSLLLIVVIRSQVRHLQARLSYMQKFIYIDDVESGEIGYCLSTFEAVVLYLMRESGALRTASQRNRRLWLATKTGNVAEMKATLEPDDDSAIDAAFTEEPDEHYESTENYEDIDTIMHANGSANGHLESSVESLENASTQPSSLSHVFPFQTQAEATPSHSLPRRGKKVSMDLRSLSSSSAFSFHSRTTTLCSTTSALEGDTSVDSLVKTQDPSGNSIPMMAIEGRQPDSLRYLLSLDQHFPAPFIIEDATSEGTTLLSAAVQLAHTEIIDIMLSYACGNLDEKKLEEYLSRPDARGRTVAHYLFSAPQLISRLDKKLPWRQKDNIGQTPLFALCRSYDHPGYYGMVTEALKIATSAQGDGKPLRLDDHVDKRGNTLLHIVNEPAIINWILQQCDSDPNAINDKKFTPLMLASKYGRVDMVRIFFSDPRVDLSLKEIRGLTAVELAKDDEVRNRIDDLTLFSNSTTAPSADSSGRITTVVRSFFVEDGTIRFVLKSGAPSKAPSATSTTYSITTCRRSIIDFENLAKWLMQEHPASYMPDVFRFRSPFQIHSKPSRAVLHDTQMQIDRFLKVLLSHPTFSTHETLWEFFLVPDMQSDMISQRAQLKSQLHIERINDEYDPVPPTQVKDVENLINHSREMVRSVNVATRSVLRRGHGLQQAIEDFADAVAISVAATSTLGPPISNVLPQSYIDSLNRYSTLMSTPRDSSPIHAFSQTIASFHSTILATLSSLSRPSLLISDLTTQSRNLSRNRSSLASTSTPRGASKFFDSLPGSEGNKERKIKDLEKKIANGEKELERLGKELAWTREVVVGELAGWNTWREQAGRDAVKRLARGMVIRERERGKGLERCLRALKEGK
ncbi:putative vps9 domain-containing protein [Phaeomoniella chlamydospora]|uniref:Putative vps9 domain-containing protein n=1 Tax=Phaeomoniella chlamydospora TaxID=158046 RepID=A0A0G2HF67_PHACM|nr:putative vps9 domain-containing protein [Phaeomoniella chlamydospora]